MTKLPPFGLMTILATCMVAADLLFGLGYDRQGSVELFFSGIALFLLKDILEHKAAPYFREHRRLFLLMVACFTPGSSVFLLLAAVEFTFYNNFQSSLQELSIIDVLGGALLTLGIGTLGIGPYISWSLKSRK